MGVDEILKRAKKIHGDRYIYDIQIQPKNNSKKIRIICPEHGEFFQKINSHLLGAGCPKCNMSRGERVVTAYLERHKLPYEYQKRFSTCRRFQLLSFDFYLPKFNVIIEFDGEQHFRPYYKGKNRITRIKDSQVRDQIKDEWALKNKKILLRIDTIDKIDQDLTKFLRDIKEVVPGLHDKRRKGKYIAEIIDMYNIGWSLGQLSKMYPYTKGMIKEILISNEICLRSRSEQRKQDYKFRNKCSVVEIHRESPLYSYPFKTESQKRIKGLTKTLPPEELKKIRVSYESGTSIDKTL